MVRRLRRWSASLAAWPSLPYLARVRLSMRVAMAQRVLQMHRERICCTWQLALVEHETFYSRAAEHAGRGFAAWFCFEMHRTTTTTSTSTILPARVRRGRVDKSDRVGRFCARWNENIGAQNRSEAPRVDQSRENRFKMRDAFSPDPRT